MKALLPILLAGSAPLLAATPTSLDGLVYRETTFNTTRQTWEKTIVFQANGHFTTLIDSRGTPLDLSAPRTTFLQPTHDGTYVYQRTNDTAAQANLTFDDGTTSAVSIPSDTTSWTPTTAIQITSSTATAPTTNLSLRGHVDAGHPLIAGFVVGGSGTDDYQQFVPPAGVVRREILIRVVGPGLNQFGVTGAWTDPDFQLFQNGKPANVNEAHYGDWAGGSATSVTATEFSKIFRSVGAFALDPTSKDAAAVVRLSPGAYTVVCNVPSGDAGGEVLIEVYLLP